MPKKLLGSTFIALFTLICVQVEAHTQREIDMKLMNLRRQIDDCRGKFICGVQQTGKTCTVDCIDADLFCDGIPQCKHGNDEHDCPQMCEGLVICPDGKTCARPCDGKAACADGEDEENCGAKCPVDEFLCRDRVTCAVACDGRAQCRGGEDETHCPPTCRTNQTLCADGSKCNTPCNGTPECRNDGDERNCPFECRCARGEYRCKTAQKCIDAKDVCEGSGDRQSSSCLDGHERGDDEANPALGFACSP